ncbi:MAG: hypothetical protein RR866_03500, partial [Raoultibacter sp.]
IPHLSQGATEAYVESRAETLGIPTEKRDADGLGNRKAKVQTKGVRAKNEEVFCRVRKKVVQPPLLKVELTALSFSQAVCISHPKASVFYRVSWYLFLSSCTKII